jgi:hypothetical protein
MGPTDRNLVLLRSQVLSAARVMRDLEPRLRKYLKGFAAPYLQDDHNGCMLLET